MFTFAIARGVNRGWLQPVYGPVAQAGWRAVEQRVRPDGTLDGACCADDRRLRRGLLLQPSDDTKAMQGFGAVLMAGAEVTTMLRNFEVQKRLNTFHYFPKKQ